MPIASLALAGAALLPAMLAACRDDDAGGDGTGGDGSADGANASEAERPYVDAFVEDITEEGEEFTASEAEAECFGLRIVRVVGADELQDQGVTPTEYVDAGSLDDLGVDVPDDAAAQVSAALTDCFDDLTGVFGQGLAEAGEGAECLAESLDETRLADALADSFVGGGDADEAIAQAIFAGLSPACAEQLLVRAGVESGDITEDAAACMTDQLDDEVALRALRANAGGDEPDPDDVAAIEDATLACM
jgi:hypothetical protein